MMGFKLTIEVTGEHIILVSFVVFHLRLYRSVHYSF